MQTIKQIADYLGVSKTTVRNRLTELELLAETEKNDKGVITIPDHVCKVVIDSFKKAEQQTAKAAEPEPQIEQQQPIDANTLLIDALQQRITAQSAIIADLKDLISRQQTTIDTLTFTVNNANSVTAGTLQTFQQLTTKAADPQPAEQADTSFSPRPEAEPAQPAEPPKAADTSYTPSEPPQSHTINTTPNSYTDTTAQAKSRVQPLKALQSLFKRNR